MSNNDLKLSPASSKDSLGVLAMLLFKVFLALGLVAFITIGSSSFAQSQSTPMPANAQYKSYGDGWECDRGFRRDGDACLPSSFRRTPLPPTGLTAAAGSVCTDFRR